MDKGKLVVDQICLTLQSPNMISVIEPVLWLHLHIPSLGEFVIFYEITGFLRGGFSPIISMDYKLYT